MDVRELAAYQGTTISTVDYWGCTSKAPAYRFGKHREFVISDVRACIARLDCHSCFGDFNEDSRGHCPRMRSGQG